MNRSFFLGMLFSMGALAALVGGISLAAFHERGGSIIGTIQPNAVPSQSQNKQQYDFQRLVASATSILQNAKSASDQLYLDCKYRHPSSGRAIDLCREDGMADFKKINALWSNSNSLTKMAIAYCIDDNPSMNGVDWSRVGWCVESAIVQIKKQS